MRSFSRFTSVVCGLALAPVLAAQQPAPPPGMRGPMRQMDPGPGAGPGADGGGPVGNAPGFLLGHTGELRLTDAQVVKLAAIARRADDRHRAMRASMDSMAPMAPEGMPMRPDSANRAQMARRFSQMEPAMRKMMDAGRTELRDAIAVLTPDQQAQAWEMVARSARGGGRPNIGMAQMRMRGGMPRDGMEQPEEGMRMRGRPDAGNGRPPRRPPDQQ